MQTIYRVMMLTDGEWELWTNYQALDDAILAANGLVLSKTAGVEACHIHEIRNGADHVIAVVELDENKRPAIRKIM